MKRNGGALVLVGVLAVTGGFLAWDLMSEKSKETRKLTETRLFPFEPDQVNEFTIETGTGKIRLVRTVDGWKLEEPLQDWADSSFVDDYIERAVKDRYVEVAAEGEGVDWKIYGLDAPVGKLTVRRQTGESRTIEVSAKQNFEQNCMVRIAGENRALIAPSSWLPNVQRTALEFRDKRLFRRKIGGVDRIEIKNAAGSFALERKDGKWSVPAHPAWPLDQNRVREVLSMVNEVRAADFVTVKAPAALTMTLTSGDKKWTAEMGKNKDGEFASVSDPAFLLKLEPNTIAKFSKLTAEGFRDLRLPFDFDKTRVRRIELATALKKATFVKTGDRWALEEKTEGVEPDQEKLNRLAEKIAGTKAARYVAGAPAGYKPIHRLRLADADGKTVFEMGWTAAFKDKIDDQTGDVVWAKTDHSDEMIAVDEPALAQWELPDLTKNQKAAP